MGPIIRAVLTLPDLRAVARPWLWLLLLAACPPAAPKPPPPLDPPQVFLVVPKSNVVGAQLELSVNVNGCDAVANLSIFHQSSFIREVAYQGNPTQVVLASNDLGALYPSLGIAADLTLVAQATCDDGRINKSSPTGVKFFPVVSVVAGPAGAQAVPDVFFAEGGLAGTEPSFIGCIGTAAGTALARVNARGAVVAINQSLPFPCSYSSQFSDKNLATGKRWMVEVGKGALCFDQALNITSYHLGRVTQLGVTPDGDAILYVDGLSFNALKRIAHDKAPPVNNFKWGFQPAGVVNASPVVNGLGSVTVPSFRDELGQYRGVQVIENVDLVSGTAAGSYDLQGVDYGYLNNPVIPPAVLSSDGSILYFPFQVGIQINSAFSQVLACATNQPACSGAARRWESPVLEGVVLANVPFANGTQLAAIAANRLTFLDTSNGRVLNLNNKPIVPDGSLVTLGAQPGVGTDFFPAGGYPVEIVAVDAAGKGELYRYQMNGGLQPGNALTIAVDDAGQAWLRIGLELVKPLPLAQYRLAKGNP